MNPSSRSSLSHFDILMEANVLLRDPYCISCDKLSQKRRRISMQLVQSSVAEKQQILKLYYKLPVFSGTVLVACYYVKISGRYQLFVGVALY